MKEAINSEIIKVDYVEDNTVELVFQIPPPLIVLFQGILESYEGLGTARTKNEVAGLMSVTTTPAMLSSCYALIENLLLREGFSSSSLGEIP